MQTIKNKILPILTLLFTLLMLTFGAGKAMAQTYNGGTWYSLFDTNEYSVRTRLVDDNIHTYSVYPPVDGSFSFDSKLPGDGSASKITTSASWADPKDYGVKSYTISFGGQTVSVSQNISTSYSSSSTKVLGVRWYTHTYTYTYNYSTSAGSNLETNTNSVSVVYKTSGADENYNDHVYLKNVKIPMAPHIRLKSSNNANGVTEQTLTDFANTIWGTTCSDANRKTVYFRSFLTGNNNANANITITSSNPEVFRVNGANSTAAKVFNVGKNAFAYENGSGTCSAGNAGKVSNYTFNVYFHPTEAKEYTGTITITDGVSTAYVYVSGTGIKRDQTIQDFPTGTATAKTTDVIDFNAYTTDNVSGEANGQQITYSSDKADVATVNSTTGEVAITTSGTVTFTAKQTGTNGYNSTSKSVTYTISKVTPMVTWPTINNGLIYTPGAKVEDHWTGGSAINDKGNDVDGDFSCTEELQPAKNASGYTVTFTPDNLNWYNSTSATIQKDVAKADQEITWGSALTAGEEYPAGTHMDATATSGLGVYYVCSKADSAFGYVNPITLELVVVQPNHTITIIAKQDGNANWNPAEPVSKTIVTCGTRPDSWNVSAADLTYGQALEESELTGVVKYGDKVITGDLAWVNPTAIPVAGSHADEYEVRFTPTGEDANAYSSIKFTVDITVHKATPEIKWNIGTNLRASSRYSNFFVSNSNGACTVTTSNNTLLSVSDNVLETGSVASATNGWIEITQAATDNYIAITEAIHKDVTVKPRGTVCLPVTVDEATTMNNMTASSDGTVEWCAATNTVEAKYVPFPDSWAFSWIKFDVRYTQFNGIKLGNWDEGFSSLGAGFWKDFASLASQLGDLKLAGTDKSIELTFTGVPDSLSFDARLQNVYFDLFTWTDANQKDPVWKVYQKSIEGEETIIDSYAATNEPITIKVPLNSTTRSVRIVLHSTFAGFVENLTITQKKYLTVDEASLTFGTNEHPLQVPQTITMRYSSLGACKEVDPHISITSDNAAFYVDEQKVVNNVGIDYMGVYTVRVRCNDVNQSGTLTLASSDGTKTATVTLSSAKPELTTTAHSIFQTGTEHATGSGAYRALTTVDYSKCFDGGTPLFDTVYVYGVSASAAGSRTWEDDANKGYKVPTIDVATGNVHTPCFVYERDNVNNKYVHTRTFDAATTTLDISSANGKLAFIGYKPASLTTTIPAIRIINGTNSASLYLNKTEILASGAILELNGVKATIFARDNNILTSHNDATVKFIDSPSELVVEDNWINEPSGFVALNAAVERPSIQLNSANDSVIIRGSQLQLQNAKKMAIALIDDKGKETHEGLVHIYDGTITGADTLGMPKRTFIDGGTFNEGTVVAYTFNGKPKRPRNSHGEMLSRQPMSEEDLSSKYSWYGQNHLSVDGYSKVNPMLMDDNVWIFNGTNGESYNDPGSWNKGSLPGKNVDVLINAPIVISGNDLSVKSITINWEDNGKGVPAVTVNPDAGLTIGEGGIDQMKVNSPSQSLVLKASQDGEAKGQTGYLRIHPESAEPMPEATVEMFSIGYYNKKNNNNGGARQNAQWQYVGSPLSTEELAAKTVFTESKLYNWDEEHNTWKNGWFEINLKPWEGYATTQTKYEDGCLITFAGELVTNKTVTIPLTSKGNGENMLANSFSAPIDVTKLQPKDFVNTQGTIYIFNTGTYNQAQQQSQNQRQVQNYYEAGQLIPIAVVLAQKMAEQFSEDKLPKTIAPMQGFIVNVDKIGEPASVTFNYMDVVYSAKNPNTILRAPKKAAIEDDMPITGTLKLTMQSENWSDRVYMLESEQYNVDYENGYDAPKSESGMSEVFVCTDDKELAINATNSIIGTRIGVRTSDEVNYSFHFSYVRAEDELALLDNETNETTDINEGTEYTFYAAPNSEILGRFQIVERAAAPSTPTGVEGAESEIKVHKFIKDNQLYILKNGVLYNGTGAVVR